MAEDNQEMEDILSSIKNILEEDEQQQKSAALNEDDNVSDDALNEDLSDDIVELSPDMRIKKEVDASEQKPKEKFSEDMNSEEVSKPEIVFPDFEEEARTVAEKIISETENSGSIETTSDVVESAAEPEIISD